MSSCQRRTASRRSYAKLSAGQPRTVKIPHIPCAEFFLVRGGDGWRNFEQRERFSYSNVDKIIRKLRRIYQERPDLFEIPMFAQKVY